MIEALKSLGKELADQRHAKGVTVAQLANVTKISPQYIEMMENGRFDFLPDVYVRAFLRAVAGEIGLDPDVMARQLVKITTPVENASAAEIEERVQRDTEERPVPISPTTTWLKKHLATEAPKKDAANVEKGLQRWLNVYTLGGLAIILTVILLVVIRGEKKGIDQEIDSGIAVAQKEPPTLSDLKTLIPIDVDEPPDTVRQEPISIHLRAIETAWVRIVFDDSLAEEGLFSPGDTRTWTSGSGAYFKIGNAGGIRIMVNGNDLGVAGGKGRVANLLVSRQGIKPVTEAEFPPAMRDTEP